MKNPENQHLGKIPNDMITFIPLAKFNNRMSFRERIIFEGYVSDVQEDNHGDLNEVTLSLQKPENPDINTALRLIVCQGTLEYFEDEQQGSFQKGFCDAAHVGVDEASIASIMTLESGDYISCVWCKQYCNGDGAGSWFAVHSSRITINEKGVIDFYKELYNNLHLQAVTDFPSPWPSSLGKLELRIKHIVEDVTPSAKLIAKELNLGVRDAAIYVTAALLHDYYQVLQIAESAPDPHLHHSNRNAVRACLFDNGKIDEYVSGLSNYEKTLIEEMIVQHAKIAVELPEEHAQDPRFVQLCNLLRDADKCGIYKIIQDSMYVLKNDWGFSEEQIVNCRSKDDNASGISEKVLADFMSGQCITNTDIKTPADWVISQLGYLYNIHSEPALDIILPLATTYIENLPTFPAGVNDALRQCLDFAIQRVAK